MPMIKNKRGMKHHSKSGAYKTIKYKQAQVFRRMAISDGNTQYALQLFPHLKKHEAYIMRPRKFYPRRLEGIFGRTICEQAQIRNFIKMKERQNNAQR